MLLSFTFATFMVDYCVKKTKNEAIPRRAATRSTPSKTQ